MALVWTEELAVGEKEIDAQHRALFKVFASIRQAYDEGKSDKEMTKLLARLDKAASRHFDAEERLLEECGYAKLDWHQDEHADFVERVGALRSILRQHGSTHRLFPIARASLVVWFANHIRTADRNYLAQLRREFSPAAEE